VLEGAEAIRNLKARYAALCDNQYDADGIASLITDDAVWESPALGIFSFAIHCSLNGHIEADGDAARRRRVSGDRRDPSTVLE
jgi:hypothetical protein